VRLVGFVLVGSSSKQFAMQFCVAYVSVAVGWRESGHSPCWKQVDRLQLCRSEHFFASPASTKGTLGGGDARKCSFSSMLRWVYCKCGLRGDGA
jgi:hypothetical protein